MEDRSPISFEEYLQFNVNGRGNLGDMLPVTVYRMLEFRKRKADRDFSESRTQIR